MANAANTTGTIGDTSAAVGAKSINTQEAKSRFNAALEEAKAGVAALSAEAKECATSYTDQAKSRGGDWSAEAKTKATELAYEGKAKASGALSSLSKVVADNAGVVEEKLGAKCGDYARDTSRSLDELSARLEAKSIEELGEDAREFVRKSPATAVGIAAFAGFMVARLFRTR